MIQVATLILLESFLQYIEENTIALRTKESQSLFYWNPFCNNRYRRMLRYSMKSQSLFYWNPFCNLKDVEAEFNFSVSRNPYFIGILSAI